MLNDFPKKQKLYSNVFFNHLNIFMVSVRTPPMGSGFSSPWNRRFEAHLMSLPIQPRQVETQHESCQRRLAPITDDRPRISRDKLIGQLVIMQEIYLLARSHNSCLQSSRKHKRHLAPCNRTPIGYPSPIQQHFSKKSDVANSLSEGSISQ